MVICLRPRATARQDVLGVFIEKYENEHVPELTE
jgi:hypothetical protein